jgi:hypothetical protein
VPELNTHVHFHVCVVDGVFEAFPAADSAESVNAQPISFHPAVIDDAAIGQVQANVRKRLLRYCARPPFAMDRFKQRGADLVYRCGKGHTESMQSDKHSGELVLTPLELIDRIAQLVPPPIFRGAWCKCVVQRAWVVVFH